MGPEVPCRPEIRHPSRDWQYLPAKAGAMVYCSLSIQTPASRLMVARRLFVRHGAILGAIGGLAGTAALGLSGTTPLPGFGSIVLTGLMAIAGLGALAWHFARLTILPLADPAIAALIAALTVATLAPGMGLNALILPAILSLWVGWRHREQRLVALMVQCGALSAMIPDMVNPEFACSLTVTALGIAWFFAAKSLSGAANDNPSMERNPSIYPLWVAPACDIKATDSIPGKWGVSNVQQ
ncbi:hypothetical protein P1X14_04850 [Sphingomonas sp. AOB5]|uniref:hypothetical protein n=1 Tax=Sphingomonas sp. AOB5 TaxID=3034017 RepID=UPI0023F76193|nr:hypothetical protein [Sphingomonas sp. AOB5]MDF7774566.1 hypothetical protein [Sphingomonas sp. AOB5]